MRAAKNREQGRHKVFVVAGAIVISIALVAAVLTLNYIDTMLKSDAEQQVQTITEQTANNVADHFLLVEAAFNAFTLQTDDPEQAVPALQELKNVYGFASVSFVNMEGKGSCDKGTDFGLASLKQGETAISREKTSLSRAYALDDGTAVRLVQKPLYKDGRLIGALYVEIASDMFAVDQNLEIFDGASCFILFDSTTEDIIIPPNVDWGPSVELDTSIYEYLIDAQRPLDEGPTIFQEAIDAQDRSYVARVERAVAINESELFLGVINGKPCYVCVAPVGIASLYACNIVPEKSVRAEAAIVTTSFAVVYAIVVICLIVALVMVAFFSSKRMQERNVEMKTRLYGALSNSLDMAVNMYSPEDGVVTPIVAKAREIVGFPMAEIMNNPKIADKIMLSEEGRSIIKRIRLGKIDDLEQGSFSFEGKADGKTHWVAYSVNPFVYEEKLQILVVFRDATSEKNLQLSMKDAMVAAETANEAKSDFLSRMSHEIRTPMNVIIGMSTIARNSVGDDKKVSESLDKIHIASDHLLSLINDVLDISKIESGKMILAKEPFDLRDLVNRSATVIRAQSEQKHQEFTVSLEGIEAGDLIGDQVRLQQLLLNLLSNAVKYTPEGGNINLSVVESPSSVDQYVRVTISVADNGIGMSEEYKEHVFEPFEMEGRSNSQGTGLGMPIVKNIVTMMNGDIYVESVLDEGTTFTVVLNLKRAEPDDSDSALSDAMESMLNAVEEKELRVASAYSGGAQPTGKAEKKGSADHELLSDLSSVKVLVAEDNELNAEIVKELLSDVGMQVTWAQNGKQALILFEESDIGYYDIILMDIQMPVMNGYEAARAIRTLDRCDAGEVPIVAMSANAFMDDVQESLRCGMNDHLSKPIDIRVVLATIDELVWNRRRGKQGKSIIENSVSLPKVFNVDEQLNEIEPPKDEQG